MSKRVSTLARSGSSLKKTKFNHSFMPSRIATAQAAAAVDADPPLPKLIQEVNNRLAKPEKGGCVAYWMRMSDLRITDNRALARASEEAVKSNLPLVVLFVICRAEYILHDRSPLRIDFMLRNLACLDSSLAARHIPLHTTTHGQAQTIPQHVLSILQSLRARYLFANIEYEVDELRRDIAMCKLAQENDIQSVFVHDKCIVEPGVLFSKQGQPYTVYTPYLRNWEETVQSNKSRYLENCGKPHPNPETIRNSELYGPLFGSPVPDSLEGFELTEEELTRMSTIWPAGEEAAAKILDRFLHTKSQSSCLGAVDPLTLDAKTDNKGSRIMKYHVERDKVDCDSSSRISPYLASGVISARSCVRATMDLLGIKHVNVKRDSGVGRWVQELAWRDFYAGILAAFPRVSMGRPFHEKYAGVVWQDENEREAFTRWQEGRTGVPIVDAAMRCLKEMGWLHNRLRMIVAMYLTKDLMLDWRLGERYFMQKLVDGDFASNNGGWQWSASTGTDAAPYFRIFNPYTQSSKVDPTGSFIKRYVPELAKLHGTELHNPPEALAEKFGYPKPILSHHDARQRALRRYKNPGDE